MARIGPKHYRSLEEFEREELQPRAKAGWSIDDLFNEARFKAADESYGDDAEELDLGP